MSTSAFWNVTYLTTGEVTLELCFYHSKRKFTMVNGFFNVTPFSHFTMVNTILVCCINNRGRMKAKFSIAKTIWKSMVYLVSKLCLLRWHVVMILRSTSWFCWICTCPRYTWAFYLLPSQSFDHQSVLSDICNFGTFFAMCDKFSRNSP